jgi:hypothetical protein
MTASVTILGSGSSGGVLFRKVPPQAAAADELRHSAPA